MVVDDDPASLRLLDDALRPKGYAVRSFPSGGRALAAARRDAPDLILLDVGMPGLNGYEICERLKLDSNLSQIPVIFITGLRETEDKVKAFGAGGADHISKPFQLEEVFARVETHLKVHDLQRALQRQNELLEETVASRTRELAEANAELTTLDAAKNDFLSIISHELRTPLNGLLGVGDLILGELPASAENEELRHMFGQSRHRIVSLLDDALLLTQIDVRGTKFTSAPVSLNSALTRAIERSTECAVSRNVKLQPPFQDMGWVRGEEDLLVRALHVLLETAVRCSEAGSTVVLTSEMAGDTRKLIIDSDGKTMATPAMAKVFDVFSLREGDPLRADFGFGLPLACRVLLLVGARVSVANRDSAGIRLTISF